jgi:hypothetical protein
VDANFAIRPIDWQFELDQVVTEFYVNANFAIGPFVWQIEIERVSLSLMWRPTLPLDQLTE